MQPSIIGSQPPLVLCVDDDPAVLTLVASALESEGYAVLTARDDEAALNMFASAAVNAVVLDYEMPGASGLQLARKLKHLNPVVPKVLFTAHPYIPRQARELVEAFCSKLDGTRALLWRLNDMVGTTSPEPNDNAALAMHIAVARFRPDWDAGTPAAEDDVLQAAACQ